MIGHAQITYLGFVVNMALDTGRYDDLTVSEVKDRIRDGTILSFLRERFAADGDLNMPSDDPHVVDAVVAAFQGLADAVDENRKMGIQNRGLCLLVAYCLEVAQHPTSYGFELPVPR